VVSQSGRNDSGTDPFGPNRNEILVDLQPYETWPAGMRKADLVETLRQRLSSAIPGATLNFTQPIIDTSTEMATGSSADLAVIVRGPDLQQLRALGHSIREVVAAIPGAADTAIEQEADQPQLRISLLREELARFGIAVTDVQHLIGMAIGGRPIDVVYEDDRRFPVALRFVAEARDDPESIGRILIATRSGGRVPLAQVATIELRDGASIIARRDNVRQLTVRTNIRGRDQGSFVAQAQAAVQAAIRLPRGYRLEWGGQFENLDRARRRLALILPLTVAIIFGLLYFAFNSVRRALLVFVSVPLSLAGGVVALWLRGMNLSVSAAVGFISLFGVAVMSGVLLVDAIERARTQEPELAVAVSTGAGQQLRPLLLMIVVALLGMVPAAIATGIGSDVQRPLATVLVGGLLSTLLLAPVVVPALYVLIAARPRRMRGGTPVDDDDDDDAPGEGTAG
jgi:cobalt-zinc-cadmium resistance protein CzcA